MSYLQIAADKVARQQNNAIQAFDRASGRVVFRVGSDFVQGHSKSARAALKAVAGPNDTKRAFVAAFIAVCEQNGLTPKAEGERRGTSFITIDLPNRKR